MRMNFRQWKNWSLATVALPLNLKLVMRHSRWEGVAYAYLGMMRFPVNNPMLWNQERIWLDPSFLLGLYPFADKIAFSSCKR